MKHLLLIGLLFSFFQAIAQNDIEKPDKKHKFIFSFDTRNSFVSKDRARMFGLKPGWQHEKKYRFGFGIYGMDDEALVRNIPKNPKNLKEGEIEAFLNMSFLGFYYEPIFHAKGRWEFSAPLILGLGSSKFVYQDNKGNDVIVGEEDIALIEPSFFGHYKFYYWIGLGGGVGYRLMLKNNDLMKDNFNSPIYNIKIKLFVGELYRKFIKKKDISIETGGDDS